MWCFQSFCTPYWARRTKKSCFVVILRICLLRYKKQWISPLSPPRNAWDFFLVIRGTCLDRILTRKILEEFVHFLIQDLTLLILKIIDINLYYDLTDFCVVLFITDTDHCDRHVVCTIAIHDYIGCSVTAVSECHQPRRYKVVNCFNL